MVETSSNNIPLGTKAINFTLQDQVSSKSIELEKSKGEIGTVIIFMCNHCPYVIHIIDKFVEIAKKYETKGIKFIAINSNDVKNYPEDAPDQMKIFASNHNITFPYLFDENQEIAKAFDAACTPDLYVYDSNLNLTYQGRFDDSTPRNNQKVTGNDLINSLDCMLNQKQVSGLQHKSMGCNIKWQ